MMDSAGRATLLRFDDTKARQAALMSPTLGKRRSGRGLFVRTGPIRATARAGAREQSYERQ